MKCKIGNTFFEEYLKKTSKNVERSKKNMLVKVVYLGNCGVLSWRTRHVKNISVILKQDFQPFESIPTKTIRQNNFGIFFELPQLHSRKCV